MAVGYECPECRTKWPHYKTFATCPQCSVVCRSAVAPNVLTAGEAKSRLNRIAFIRYYSDRERSRTGPTPEERGRTDAMRDAAEIRRLNRILNDDDPGD